MSKDRLHRMIDALDDADVTRVEEVLGVLLRQGSVVLAAELGELRRCLTNLSARVGYLEGSFKGFERRFDNLVNRARV